MSTGTAIGLAVAFAMSALLAILAVLISLGYLA